MKTLRRPVPAATAVLVILVLVWFRPRLNSDVAVYWSWFSMLYDGDINPGNQLFPVMNSWARVYLNYPTAGGYYPIVFPLGPALSWLPGLLIGEGLAAAVDGLTAHSVPAARDGFDWLARMPAMLMSAVWVLAGLELLRRWLRQWFSPRNTEHALLAILLGTPLIFYVSFDPGFSHAFEFFILSALCACFGRKKTAMYTPLQIFSAGMIASLVLYTRLQDAGWVAVPLGMILTDQYRNHRGSIWETIRAALLFGTGTLVAYLPQFYLWGTLHGTLLPPYPENYFLYAPVHAVRVFFSIKRGLFTWSPVLLAALAGLFLAPRSLRRRLAVTAIGVLYVAAMSASVSDWWGGGCFGARRFTGSLPFFAAALAALFQRLSPGADIDRRGGTRRIIAGPWTKWGRRALIGLIGAAVLWNLLLMMLYVSDGIPADELIATLWRHPLQTLATARPLQIHADGLAGQLAQLARLPGVGNAPGAAVVTALVSVIMLMWAAGFRWNLQRVIRRISGKSAAGLALVTTAGLLAAGIGMHLCAGTHITADLNSGVTFVQREAPDTAFTGNGTTVTLPFRGHRLRSENDVIRLDPIETRYDATVILDPPVQARGIRVMMAREDLDRIWRQGQALTIILEYRDTDGNLNTEPFTIRTPEFGRAIRWKIPGDRLVHGNAVDDGEWAHCLSWDLTPPRNVHSVRFEWSESFRQPVRILGLGFDPATQTFEKNQERPRNRIQARTQIGTEVETRMHPDGTVAVRLDIRNPGTDRPVDLYVGLRRGTDRPLFYRFNPQVIRGEGHGTGIPVILDVRTPVTGELMHDFVYIAPGTPPSEILFAAWVTPRGVPAEFLGEPATARIEMTPVEFREPDEKPLIAIKREGDDVSDGGFPEDQHDEAIDTQGDPRRRRHPLLQRADKSGVHRERVTP